MVSDIILKPRRFLTLALVSLIVLLGVSTVSRPTVASAHPLGNFTINRYALVQIQPAGIQVRYILDMAEIPAFQEQARMDGDRDGQVSKAEEAAYLENVIQTLQQGITLSINGSPVTLETLEQQLSFPPGQGGLATLRLSLLWQGELAPSSSGQRMELHYRDDNYAQRLGWREIVVQAGPGVSLLTSTAPEQDQTNMLQEYPEDLLNSPPDLREAQASFLVGVGVAQAEDPVIASNSAEPRFDVSGTLTSFVNVERLSLPVIVLAFLVAVGLGAAHALTPGHGKTIMAAYLVGTRGTAAHALFLGLTVTISHTLGVLLLALTTLYFSTIISPESLYPWLGLVSGVIVVGLGIWMLAGRLRKTGSGHLHSHEDHGHSHGHHHHHPGNLSWKSLAALGAANGLIPSASALIILLAAISLHRVGFGLLLILAFSAGMAIVLAGIGLLLVYAGRAAQRFRFSTPFTGLLSRVLPVGTAVVVLVSGLVVAARSIFNVGLF